MSFYITNTSTSNAVNKTLFVSTTQAQTPSCYTQVYFQPGLVNQAGTGPISFLSVNGNNYSLIAPNSK